MLLRFAVAAGGVAEAEGFLAGLEPDPIRHIITFGGGASGPVKTIGSFPGDIVRLGRMGNRPHPDIVIDGLVLGGDQGGDIIGAGVVGKTVNMGQPAADDLGVDEYRIVDIDISQHAAVWVAASFGVGDSGRFAHCHGLDKKHRRIVVRLPFFGAVDADQAKPVAAGKLDSVAVDDAGDAEAVARGNIITDLGDEAYQQKEQDKGCYNEYAVSYFHDIPKQKLSVYMIKIKYETGGNLYITKMMFRRFFVEVVINCGADRDFSYPAQISPEAGDVQK